MEITNKYLRIFLEIPNDLSKHKLFKNSAHSEINDQQNKKIGIYGLGLTGCSAFKVLRDVCEKLICYDDSEKIRNNFKEEFSSEYLHGLESGLWNQLDKIVISPGLPKTNPIFSHAASYNIPISSDFEIFYEENCNSVLILISGTNGKSTTTSLINHILKSSDLDYCIGGNIGIPILSLPIGKKGYVLEISSFQIDLLQNFKANISILLNITPDHLDRHGTFEEYIRVKEKILDISDIKIIGVDNEITREIYNKRKNANESNLIEISGSKLLQFGISCFEEKIFDNYFDKEGVYSFPEHLGLLGRHNFENVSASFAACRALGINPEKIIESIKIFKSLDHRMQNLGSHEHINFFNDSKATNIGSAIASLSCLKNIFWLAGGIFKEKDFSPLDFLLCNIKKAFLFGKNKSMFANYLSSKNVDYIICENMYEAFELALKDASLDKTNIANIVLAPACASFDQFKNFEERGNIFMQLVHKYKIDSNSS